MQETMTIIVGHTHYGSVRFIALSDVSSSVKTSSRGGSMRPSLGAFSLGCMVAEHVATHEHIPLFSCSIIFAEAAEDGRIPDWVRKQYKHLRPITTQEQRFFDEGFEDRLAHVRTLYAPAKK